MLQLRRKLALLGIVWLWIEYPSPVLSANFNCAATSGCVSKKASDAYMACLIGRASVVLEYQKGRKDADKAMAIAWKNCKPTWNVSKDEGEGEAIDDIANANIQEMAHEQNKNLFGTEEKKR